VAKSSPTRKSGRVETDEQREKRLAYHREWMRKFRKANPDRTKATQSRHYGKHKDEYSAKRKARYAKKRDEIIAQVCAYAKKNREKINARKKAREAADPERTKELRTAGYLRYREKDKLRRAARRVELAEYMRHKRNSDPAFLVADRLRRRINAALACFGAKKAGSLFSVAGCSVAKLVSHIESQFVDGMSWDNRSQWHIDHIIPCSAFDLTDHGQQRVAFHYTNLRPVWSSENQRKHAKIPGGQRQFVWSHDDIKKARKRLAGSRGV